MLIAHHDGLVRKQNQANVVVEPDRAAAGRLLAYQMANSSRRER